MSFLGFRKVLRKGIKASKQYIKEMEGDNGRTLLEEVNGMDATSGSGILAVKIGYEIRSVYTVPRFPRVVFDPKTLPLDEEAKFSIDHPTVQDLLHYPLFLTIDNLRRGWGLSMATKYRVRWSRGQLDYIEHRMEPTHGRRESEPVCTITDSFFDREGTQPPV